MNILQNQAKQNVSPNPACPSCDNILQKHHKCKNCGEQHYYCTACDETFPKHPRENYKIKNPLRQVLIGLAMAGIRISHLAYVTGNNYGSLRKCMLLFLNLMPKVKLKINKIGLYPAPESHYIIRYPDISVRGSVLIDFSDGITVTFFKRIKIPFTKGERNYEILEKFTD